MMDEIRRYLLSLVCAAMISALIMRLVRGRGSLSGIAKVLCGLFITYTVLEPLPAFDISDLSKPLSQYSAEAASAGEMGIALSRVAFRGSIKERTEAYILDKAKTLEANLQVEVELSSDDIPTPKTVTISGKASPYVKKQLSGMIEKDLGVGVENQRWI